MLVFLICYARYLQEHSFYRNLIPSSFLLELKLKGAYLNLSETENLSRKCGFIVDFAHRRYLLWRQIFLLP